MFREPAVTLLHSVQARMEITRRLHHPDLDGRTFESAFSLLRRAFKYNNQDLIGACALMQVQCPRAEVQHDIQDTNRLGLHMLGRGAIVSNKPYLGSLKVTDCLRAILGQVPSVKDPMEARVERVVLNGMSRNKTGKYYVEGHFAEKDIDAFRRERVAISDAITSLKPAVRHKLIWPSLPETLRLATLPSDTPKAEVQNVQQVVTEYFQVPFDVHFTNVHCTVPGLRREDLAN